MAMNGCSPQTLPIIKVKSSGYNEMKIRGKSVEIRKVNEKSKSSTVAIMHYVLFLIGFMLMSSEGICKGRLKDKIAIITGASKGIGRGIAKVFAKEGAQVVLVSRTGSKLKKVADEITKSGGRAIYMVADVTKVLDMKNVAENVSKNYGRIDILIHNAGIYPVANIKDITIQDWNHILNTNLTSTFIAVKTCLPYMQQQKYGRVVFTSSISGPRVGWPGGSHYTASKAGMNGFMKTVAIELAKDNITVNAVELGNVLSEGLEEMTEEHREKIASGIPMGRLGTPEEIAYTHLFLASDEASYITGQSIVVDGGQILPESDQHMQMHTK
jgi:3-oxoacyl-[acyl-carrier protein] reductase